MEIASAEIMGELKNCGEIEFWITQRAIQITQRVFEAQNQTRPAIPSKAKDPRTG